ncbi:MAG: hypothetical protein GXO74_12555 [Calditrichaeota bacterium]|nr:hypothetical protein [Calditrichota bacterium]
METKKLYLVRPDLKQFEAKIVSIAPFEDHFALILDQTAFYPTSGGQMHDSGTANGIPVVDVIETDAEIVHILPEPISGDKATCQINWERRFDFMQQHTAFHILAQSFLRVTGKNTLSSHLGEEFSTIDVETAQISDREIEQVEMLANQICFENRAVRHFFVQENELDHFSLRALPTKGEQIRLVEIENFDVDPCGGTHVNYTGQVSVIKILSQEKIRGNVRLTFVAGKRALSDYQRKWKILKQLSAKLTEAEDKIINKFEKLQAEQKEFLKIKKKYRALLISKEADDLIAEAHISDSIFLTRIFENRELAEIRDLARQIINRGHLIVIFGLKNERGNLIIARSKDFEINLAALAPKINEIVNGKGGGRADFIEVGGIQTKNWEQIPDQIAKFMDKAVEQFSKERIK